MSTNISVDLVQPWRKSFPICKPPTPGDPVDAERFILEFPEGAELLTDKMKINVPFLPRPRSGRALIVGRQLPMHVPMALLSVRVGQPHRRDGARRALLDRRAGG